MREGEPEEMRRMYSGGRGARLEPREEEEREASERVAELRATTYCWHSPHLRTRRQLDLRACDAEEDAPEVPEEDDHRLPSLPDQVLERNLLPRLSNKQTLASLCRNSHGISSPPSHHKLRARVRTHLSSSPHSVSQTYRTHSPPSPPHPHAPPTHPHASQPHHPSSSSPA